MVESVSYDDEQQQTWEEIESLLDELAELARGDLSPARFYEELLSRAVSATAATSGIAWLQSGEAGFQLAAQLNLAATGLASAAAQEQHSQLLAQSIEARETRIVLPRAQFAGATNPTSCLLVIAPVQHAGQVAGLIELFHKEDVSPSSHQPLLHLATALGELAGEYHRHQHFANLSKREGFWAALNDFSQAIHETLELEPTELAIVNESRRLLGVDRVSLLTKRGRKLEVRAVSSVDKIHRRAESVRMLEKLAASMLATGEPLWTHRNTSGELPPQIEQPLEAYLDSAHCRTVAILPLMTPLSKGPEAASPATARTARKMLGALVIESFDASWDDALEQRADAALKHIEQALHQALTYHRFPLRRMLAPLAGMRWFVELQQLPKTIATLLVLVIAGLALWLIPAELGIEARGTLQPVEQRELFAPIDGIINDVLVDHGSQVEQGKTLLTLRRPELELERSQVLGELQTAKTQLASLEAARLSGTTDPETSGSQLTAKEEELKEKIASLQQQRQILDEQQRQLAVRSPLTGEVLTWNARQSLDSRPVQRGQSLLLVANLKESWELRLHVLDRHMGYVLDAAREQQIPLKVTFLLATDPRVRFTGTVEHIAEVTDVGPDDRPTAEVIVSIDRDQIPPTSLRPGSSVIAEIDCGSSSLGYVWLHDLIDAVWTYVLF